MHHVSRVAQQFLTERDFILNSLSMLSLLIEGHSNDRLDEMDIKQEYDLDLVYI